MGTNSLTVSPHFVQRGYIFLKGASEKVYMSLKQALDTFEGFQYLTESSL